MTEQKSSEHHIQLVLTALNGHIVTLKVMQLTFFEYPGNPRRKVPLELSENSAHLATGIHPKFMVCRK
jgi:hypothetical protein